MSRTLPYVLPAHLRLEPETLHQALGIRYAEGDGGAGAGDSGAAGGDQGAGDSGQQGAGTDGAGDQGQGDALPDDPAALKAEIARLRRENGSARTTAKTQAADEARNELVQSLGKALGLIKDGDAAPDADALTQQLTATQEQARQAAVELAVFRSAAAAGVDPDAVLDSRAFLTKVEGLDPAAADFTTQVTAALTEAATANPKLKAARAAGASSVDHSAGGSGEGRAPRTPKSLAAAVTGHYTG